jgi:phage terminase small subunit
MQRGRKPKPAALRLVGGNAGHRPINEAEPEPKGAVVKPAFVKGRAAKLWQELAPELEEARVLKSWDVHMFGVWCVLMAEFEKSPAIFTSAKLSQMRALGESFCLLPPGRARFKPSDDKKDNDPAEKYF